MAETLPSPAAIVREHPDWALLESHFAPVCRPFLPLADKSQPVLVACSGGCDSVALLCLIYRILSPAERHRLEVVHVHHGVRGAAADEDADWVRAAAEALDLRFYLRRLELGPGRVKEAELRAGRFRAIESCLRNIGADAVFLGHHLNDVAEGMLLALGRGAGLSGLASPRPVQTFKDSSGLRYSRLHPLLSAPRSLLASVLKSSGIGWREDASNASEDFVRNRIRKTVLPAWQAALPQPVLENVNASRELLEELECGLEQLLDTLLPEPQSGVWLDAGCLRGQPRMLWRRAFYRWVNRVHPGLELRRNLVDGLLDSWTNGGFAQRDQAGQRFTVDGYLLRSEPLRDPPVEIEWDPVQLVVPGNLLLPDGAFLRAERVEGAVALDRVASKRVDCRFEAFIRARFDTFLVGRWSPGDRMRPLGAPGSRKLQDIFTDRSI
ncbi:MAG: tRNA lysidine(34) synthetase TilS, partial [Opitutales bacterium]|nr:tRNA lysidine(34) synthetase TilS [Opitutales bacterium]